MFRVTKIILLSLLFTSVALADDDDGDDYRGGYAREYYPAYYQQVAPSYYQEEIVYVPERVVEYVPVESRYYAPLPPPRYSYDQRSPQGLLGGVVGSVMGYEMGAGNPLATGIGGAAGAWLGNGSY